MVEKAKIELKDKTVTELKAIAYDVLSVIQKSQADLAIVNNLIKKKESPVEVKVTDDEGSTDTKGDTPISES